MLRRSALSALLIRVVIVGLGTCAAAQARKPAPPPPPDDGLPGVPEVTEKILPMLDELAGNSNPAVRAVVFDTRLRIEGAVAAEALTKALADSDWGIRRPALEHALRQTKDKKLRAAAETVVAELLEVSDPAVRGPIYALIKASYAPKARLAALQRAAKDGKPEARAGARAELIADEGATGWAVIAAGLAEPPSDPEHREAMEALRSWSDPAATSWALENMHAEEPIGRTARDVLGRITEPKAVTRIEKELARQYEAKSADFEPRLRVAAVMARRGRAAQVERTLRAGLRLQTRAGRAFSWEGLFWVRELSVLMNLRETILTNEDEAESKAAYDWMLAWAKDAGEPAVLELLQEAARSDRRGLRLRAMAALTEVAHRPSAPLFESAMGEGQVEVRLAAARGLAAMAKPGDEGRLAEFLRRERELEVKKALVDGLARIGTPAIIDSLQFIISTPQKELKLSAVEALAATGEPKAALLLGLLKRDADVDVRFAAWRHVLRLAPRESLPEFRAGAAGWLTAAQVQTLAEDRSVDLEIIDHLARVGDASQRIAAVGGLVARGEAAATRLLGIVEGAHADAGALALRQLAELQKEASVPTYRKALESPHGEVRAAGFNALGRFGHRGMLEIVLTRLADKDPLARAEALRAALLLAGRAP